VPGGPGAQTPGRLVAALSAALLVALALAAGCGGGSQDADALATQAEALRSVAAEGQLLARDAAANRTTGVFLDEHAAALRGVVARAAASLTHRSAAPGLGTQRLRLAGLAGRIGADLDRLPHAPAGERRTIARRLGREADRSGAVARSLG
jgi:hypothetical protein